MCGLGSVGQVPVVCLVFNLQVVGHPCKAGGHGLTGKADLGHVSSGCSVGVGRDARQNASGIKGQGLELSGRVRSSR